jgi:hypothetical protein
MIVHFDRGDQAQRCTLGQSRRARRRNANTATASRTVRFAPNCATVGRPILEKDIAASIAISGIAKARHAAALCHDRVEAPSAMRVTVVSKPSREG